MTEAVDVARGWHRVQTSRDSCVAACRAIVDARRGGEGIERESYPALEGEVLAPLDPASLDLLVARVAAGEVAIVTVSGPRWMDLARDRKMRSDYGDLGPGLHAIVIIAAKSGFLIVLDPYFPTKQQPLQVSRDDFATAWTGEFEFA